MSEGIWSRAIRSKWAYLMDFIIFYDMFLLLEKKKMSFLLF
jgi:hypothetical protein